MASGTRCGTRSTALSAAAGVAAAPARVRTVRTILQLETRAQRLLVRYEQTLAAATRAKGQAYALLDEAHTLERALTGPELEALWRGRAESVTHKGDAAREADTSAAPTTSTTHA